MSSYSVEAANCAYAASVNNSVPAGLAAVAYAILALGEQEEQD